MSDYTEGFIEGYKAGAGKQMILPPLAPLQPLKRLGVDPKSNYDHGFVIGYEMGKKRYGK